MQNLCKSSPFSYSSCNTCKNEKKENSNLSDIFYYCSNCFNFYCLDHGKTHSINKGHNIFLNKNFENNCFEHNGINVVGYCAIHNKNYCVRCSDFDENNRIVDVELSDEQINDYEIQMKQNKKLLKDMEVLFIENKKIFENLEKNFNLFKDNINKKINFINEIINFYKIKKNESAINYQMKANIENNFFNLEQTKEIITYNLNIEQSEMNKLIQLLNELQNEPNSIYFHNFKIEKVNNIKTINNNNGYYIYCLQILDDGRLASGDYNSNLIIYNKETFNSDILIQNNLGPLNNFTQLKNKNIACSFNNNYTLKIIKILNYNNQYENIQIINNAHSSYITKILELKNENLITFSYDYSFKIWKLNDNNLYEKISEFKDINYISEGLEIKNNEIIYCLNYNNPQSLIFYNLKQNKKIHTINNLNLSINFIGNRITIININEVVIAGNGKVYLIDINKYLILNQFNSGCNYYCILKISNNLFLTGD